MPEMSVFATQWPHTSNKAHNSCSVGVPPPFESLQSPQHGHVHNTYKRARVRCTLQYHTEWQSWAPGEKPEEARAFITSGEMHTIDGANYFTRFWTKPWNMHQGLLWPLSSQAQWVRLGFISVENAFVEKIKCKVGELLGDRKGTVGTFSRYLSSPIPMNAVPLDPECTQTSRHNNAGPCGTSTAGDGPGCKAAMPNNTTNLYWIEVKSIFAKPNYQMACRKTSCIVMCFALCCVPSLRPARKKMRCCTLCSLSTITFNKRTPVLQMNSVSVIMRWWKCD